MIYVPPPVELAAIGGVPIHAGKSTARCHTRSLIGGVRPVFGPVRPAILKKSEARPQFVMSSGGITANRDESRHSSPSARC